MIENSSFFGSGACNKFLANKAGYLAKFDDTNIIIIHIQYGHFTETGAIWDDEYSTQAQVKAVIDAIKAHNTNMLCLAFVAGGQNKIVLDMSTVGLRQAYVNSCVALCNKDLGGGTRYDGVLIDIEEPMLHTGLCLPNTQYNGDQAQCQSNGGTFYPPISLEDYALCMQEIGNALHNPANFPHNNARHFLHIYYGVWRANAADAEVIASFNCDFAMVRYYPLDGSYSDSNYNMVLANCKVPWGNELRTNASGGFEGENLVNGTAFYSAKFAGGVPATYGGQGIWFFDDMTDAEYTFFSNWPYKSGGVDKIVFAGKNWTVQEGTWSVT